MDEIDDSPSEIWADDLFDRAKEAKLLIGYLESVAARRPLREDAQGITIAIDAAYGEGKSFFLKRLARQLTHNHPVAFVDAWTDDLADEPLTALAATLKRALDPLIEKSETVRSRFADVVAKSGKIAKIVGKGLFKRGAGLIITATAADALDDLIGGLDKPVKDAVDEALKSSGKDIVDDAAVALTSVAPSKLMTDRIEAFEAGQVAIREMRASLAALVESLASENVRAPIFIIIDELDRCRPTYAVKLLEEIKHLFDVPGLVFILGLHGEQLSHSVNAAYGAGFDGKAYLRRFFHRHYSLAEPDLGPLVRHLCQQAGIEGAQSYSLPIVREFHNPNRLSLPAVTAYYMGAYGLSARSAFEVVDILQTCFAIAGQRELFINYLLPLIIGHVKGLPSGELPKLDRSAGWMLVHNRDMNTRETIEIGPEQLAKEFSDMCALSKQELTKRFEAGSVRYALNAVFQTSVATEQDDDLVAVRNYPKLLKTVTRFKNPNLPKPDEADEA